MDLFPSNLSTTFPYGCPQSNENLTTLSINKPFEVRDKLGNLDGYFWYRGNSVDLVFNLDGEIVLLNTDKYNTITEVIKALTFEANILNFRNEPVMKFSTSPYEENKLIVHIEDDLNKCSITLPLSSDKSNLLVQGKYRIELIATLNYVYHETVFPAETCIFEVK